MSYKLYGAFGASNPHHAIIGLIQRGLKSLPTNPPPDERTSIRFPVAILFARGDRAGDGGALAEEAVSSFHFWHEDTKETIEFIYAGWREQNSSLIFDRRDFISFRNQFQEMCKWKYSGETDLLLLNFILYPVDKTGNFEFEEVIVLPVESMLRDKIIGSLDHLVAQITNSAMEYAARERHENLSPVWVISDKLAMLRGKKDFWDFILGLVFRDYADKLKGLGHLAVRNVALPAGTLSIELPDSES